MSQIKVVGLEVAKTQVLACELDHMPADPEKFAKNYKPQIYKPVADDLAQLASRGDLFVLEPTGVYSRIWIDYLTRAGKDVRRISPKRVTHARRDAGIESKTDRYDAAFIALLGLRYADQPDKFLTDHAEILRDLLLTHRTLSKVTTQHVNRLWRALAYEWPERCMTKRGARPKHSRPWSEPLPPSLFRFIAGERIRSQRARESELAATVGSGLSDLTRLWARHVCEIEREQYQVEQQIMAMLQCSEFEQYQSIFDSYDFGPMTRAALLSRIHPFDRFLRDDGRPVIEYVYTDNGRSKRYVSLGSFKLSLGMGTVFKQSGNSEEEKPGGASYARAALFTHCKTKIVMSPPRNLSHQRRLEHRQYFEQIAPGTPHNRALMKLCRKICKDLFNDLVNVS